MNIKSFLNSTQEELSGAGVSSARLDALILLEDELKKERSWILAHQETGLKAEQLKNLGKKIKRRLKHEPMAYIRGFSEFYGRRFMVNKNVLEPRPESEAMIELLKNLLHHNYTLLEERPLKVGDVGTGSGALAITAKLEMPQLEVIGCDIDSKCLTVARKNAKKLGAEAKFYKSDLLSSLPSNTDILVANLPYVPRNWQINQAAAMEPRIAIDGGSDGLEIYRRLFEQIKKLRNRPKYVFTESLPPQHVKLDSIAREAGYELAQSVDFIQLFELS